MKQIVHIITDLDIGGAEVMLLRLLSASNGSSEYRHIVISLTSTGPVGEKLLQRGFSVYDCGLFSVWHMPLALLKLRKLLIVLKPDIVQTWMYHSDFIGGLVARCCGIKNIIWGVRSTNVPINNRLTAVLVKINAWLSYHVPAKIVCVAQAAMVSHQQYGYTADKMLVITNGIDLDEFFNVSLPLNKMEQSNDAQLVIGCVGRFHADKGQDLLLQSFAQILQQFPNHRLKLIGRGCEESNEIVLQMICDLNIGYAVDLLGERDDVAECLKTIDIYCMPSRSEGFPNGLIEAMACGLPCVATDVGDVNVLGQGVVTIVASSSVEALTSGLFSMLHTPASDRLQMGLQAADRIKEKYSMDVVRLQFEDLYSFILR